MNSELVMLILIAVSTVLASVNIGLTIYMNAIHKECSRISRDVGNMYRNVISINDTTIRYYGEISGMRSVLTNIILDKKFYGNEQESSD